MPDRDRVFPAVRVRAVRGRTIDPFRGTPSDEPDAERLASRAVDAQPIDDLVAVLERVPGVRVVRAGRRFTLGRGHDVIKVSFASAARRVSLDDAMFEGDGNLVITVLHALLPLFGAVEVRIGDGFSALIDGHEPLAKVLEPYDAWWIDESLKLARKLAARDAAARPAPAPTPAATIRPTPRTGTLSKRQRAVAAVVLVALAIGLGVGLVRANSKGKIGEHCEKNEECDSQECLPREPMQAAPINGIDFNRPPTPFDPSGVCTKSCVIDSDCPASMQCGAVMRYGIAGIGTRSQSCIPRAWF